MSKERTKEELLQLALRAGRRSLRRLAIYGEICDTGIDTHPYIDIERATGQAEELEWRLAMKAGYSNEDLWNDLLAKSS